jgi:shikimate dehydrogenase
MGIKQFAVLGDPIEHSLSPKIHKAAYDFLGLDWVYSRFQVTADGLELFLELQLPTFSGFSLTMPLKEKLWQLAVTNGWQRDAPSSLLQASNTLFKTSEGSIGVANTDLMGAKGALSILPRDLSTVAIIGSGATARSVTAAIVQSFESLTALVVFSRNQESAANLIELAKLINPSLTCEWLPIEAASDFGGADLTVNTVPSTVAANIEVDQKFGTSYVFDVTYDNSQTGFASSWAEPFRVTGKQMLVAQAVGQLELFGAFEKRADVDRVALASTMLAVANN